MSKLSHSTTYTVLKRPEGHWTFIPDEVVQPQSGDVVASGLMFDEAQDMMLMRDSGWRADCPRCVASKFTCDEHYNS